MFPGILQPVDNLQYSIIENDYNISWSAPFSLDVPYTNPDIIYCLYIHDKFSSVPVLLNCDIIDTHFILPSNYTKCSDHIVHVIATNPAGNSTPSMLILPMKG